MTVSYSPRTDLTTLFKSCIKTIKTRNKAIGVSSPQTKIFPSKSTSQFFSKAKDILENIISHDVLLFDHRRKYLFECNNSFTDIDRACMDKVVSKTLKIIEENIRSLESNLKDDPSIHLKNQSRDCYINGINILRTKYLKTNANFRDMKDARLKKQKEKEQLFVLQRPGGSRKQYDRQKPISRIKTEKLEITADELHKNDGEESVGSKISELNIDENINIPSTGDTSSFLDHEVNIALEGLKEDEKQMLEEENQHLYQELMSNHEEVKQITRQVVELGRMQDVLTENVEIQAQQIEEIHDTILLATDNVQRGNEQVREAMRKDAGFRVWIMFFLIMMSCSLLFLDWYNP